MRVIVKHVEPYDNKIENKVMHTLYRMHHTGELTLPYTTESFLYEDAINMGKSFFKDTESFQIVDDKRPGSDKFIWFYTKGSKVCGLLHIVSTGYTGTVH